MEQKRLQFYYINMKYVRDLSRVSNHVMSVSPQKNKESRPHVGVLVLLHGREYCIPLTSTNKEKFKGKKNSMDFMKILHPQKKDEHGAYKVIGGLNFNNMIPVTQSVLTKIDFKIRPNDTPETKHYKELMKDQLNWCQSHTDDIVNKANKLYNLITNYPDQNINLTRRCCDFKKLEDALDKYLEKGVSISQQTNQSQQSQPKTTNATKRKKFTISRKKMDENAKKISKQKSQISSPNKTKKKSNNGHTGR